MIKKYKNINDMLKVSKSLDNNLLYKIINDKININDIKNSKSTKKEYYTLYINNVVSNYNKIIITKKIKRYAKNKIYNYLLKYYFLEYEDWQKDIYKIKKLELLKI